eukprot:m.170490 g.170490  ORF g.170490 m.170490 type:complete len:434 (-) comp31611_c4_seq3:268-1569(-)
MIGMPRQTLTCVLFLSLVKPSQCSLSSELKPKIYADGTTLMITSPNDVVFELGTGESVKNISVLQMLDDVRTTIQKIGTMETELDTLRANLSMALDEVANDTFIASDRMSQIMACADQNLILTADGTCISPVVTCPKFRGNENVSVMLSPEGLAYERLPGTMARFVCRDGFANPEITQSFCLSDGTWSRPLPTTCDDPCEGLTPHCSHCGNNICTACHVPYVARGNQCIQPSSCNDVNITGEYILTNDLPVYCFVGDNHKWTKINSWSRSYTTTTNAVAPSLCGTKRGLNCKHSDDNINAMISAPHNKRIYRIEAEGRPKKIYLYTNYNYNDNLQSFGIVPRQARGMVKTDFDLAEMKFLAPVFTQDWIDFYYMSKTAYRELNTCERYFVGHRYFDCYPSGNNKRCITAGAYCPEITPRYGIIPGWTMYIATV